ncbi:hypothetical protein Tco_0104394 [Tanacetum coccineum]
MERLESPIWGGRRPRSWGRLLYPQETRNLGLKAITDKSGPVPIRFEVNDRETLMPLGDHAAHWANYLGELVRELPFALPIAFGAKMLPEQKAGVVEYWVVSYFLSFLPSLTCVPHGIPTGLTTNLCGHQQHLHRVTMAKEGSLKERYWVPEEDGT